MRTHSQRMALVGSSCKRHVHKAAFSLVELLVVVGIIAMLVAILTPSLTRARKEAKKVGCSSNMRQIMMACRLYAQNEGNGVLLPGRYYNQEDSLAALYPHYITDFSAFVCPGTENVVKSVEHLKDNALGGPTDSSGGHSYELRSWQVAGYLWPDGTSTVFVPAKDVMKTIRQPGDLSKDGFLMDADDRDGTPDDLNNWPSPTDNHGAEGENIAFLDGHVEWCRTGRAILEAFINGHYTPGVPENIANPLGLQLQGNRYVWIR